jgi:hypothetical protein
MILKKTAFELMFGFNPSRNEIESRERARKQRLNKKKKEND